MHQIRIRKRRKKFQAVLKLDMKKAYDRVEWDFLEAWLDPVLNVHISSQGLTRIEDWFGSFKGKSSNSPTLELVAATLWNIWKARNQAIFKNRKPNTISLIDSVLAGVKSFNRWNPRLGKFGNKTDDLSRSWNSPLYGTYKINIDGAYEPGAFDGSVACVCRDSVGRLLEGAARKVAASSPLMAESLALLEALTHFFPKRHEALIIESDSLDLVKALQSPDHFSWEVHALVLKCKDLLQSFSSIRITHCYREANFVADWVAKAHKNHYLPLNWVFSPPQALWELLCTDAHVSGPTVLS